MTEYTHYSDINVDGVVKSSKQGKLLGSTETMPEASAKNLNTVVLYSGQTSSEYETNCLYQCQLIDSVYKWVKFGIDNLEFTTVII